MRIVLIVIFVKFCTLKFFALGCVTVKFALFGKLCYLKNWVSLKNCYTWKTALLWKFVILKTALLWKFAYWKTVLLEKLFRLDKLCYLKTALLENWFALKNCDTWETAILKNCSALKNCDTWKLTFFWMIMLIERLRWGALLVKYCVGVRYFKILLYCKNVALFENWFSLKTALLENCVTLKNCVTRELCYAEKLWY